MRPRSLGGCSGRTPSSASSVIASTYLHCSWRGPCSKHTMLVLLVLSFIHRRASSAYAFRRLNKNKKGMSGAVPRVETLFNISAFDGMYVDCIISNSGILVSANLIAATLSSSSSTMNSQRFGSIIGGSSFFPTQRRNRSIAVVVFVAFTLGTDLQSKTEKFNSLSVYTKVVLLSREQFAMSTPRT